MIVHCLGIAVRISRPISQSIQHLAEGAEKTARGDLTVAARQEKLEETLREFESKFRE